MKIQNWQQSQLVSPECLVWSPDTTADSIDDRDVDVPVSVEIETRSLRVQKTEILTYRAENSR